VIATPPFFTTTLTLLVETAEDPIIVVPTVSEILQPLELIILLLYESARPASVNSRTRQHHTAVVNIILNAPANAEVAGDSYKRRLKKTAC
jgi:hypothetical protein